MRAEAVSVHDLPFKEVGHRGEVDVRMRANVDPSPWCQLGRPHVIEEDEGPDQSSSIRGQQPGHGETTEVPMSRFDDRLDLGGRCTARADGVVGLGPAHNFLVK
jgi:hypothetical protein